VGPTPAVSRNRSYGKFLDGPPQPARVGQPINIEHQTLITFHRNSAIMPGLLGKRKSRAEEDPEAVAKAQELLRKHFEAQFKPIDLAPLPRRAIESEDEEDESSEEGSDVNSGEGDEWDGISGDEDGTESEGDESDGMCIPGVGGAGSADWLQMSLMLFR